jgi:ABC-type branched-subunit amino acid transport system permease subunit
MASLRFGAFKPNIPGLALTACFFLCFLLYILGYDSFTSAYYVLYKQDEYKAIQNMRWFLIGCPVTMLLTSILLFVVSSYSSRQILLGFSALLLLGAASFMLIGAWIGTNITRFNQEKGWETCTPQKDCARLKRGLYAFMIGAVLCCLNCVLDIGFCFLRARQIKMNEALYVGIQNDEEILPQSRIELGLHDDDEQGVDFESETSSDLED